MFKQSDDRLIQIIDLAFAEAARRSGSWLKCRAGCSQCCLGPFEITQLDAWRLRSGLEGISADRADRVRARVASWQPDAEDDPCPVLDPATGSCDLYEFRPVMCRVFGPPVRLGGASFGVCEICYDGATDEDVARCAVDADDDGLEAELVAALPAGMTTVAQALSSD